jgi:hypothetical protein
VSIVTRTPWYVPTGTSASARSAVSPFCSASRSNTRRGSATVTHAPFAADVSEEVENSTRSTWKSTRATES